VPPAKRERPAEAGRVKLLARVAVLGAQLARRCLAGLAAGGFGSDPGRVQFVQQRRQQAPQQVVRRQASDPSLY